MEKNITVSPIFGFLSTRQKDCLAKFYKRVRVKIAQNKILLLFRQLWIPNLVYHNLIGFQANEN